MGGISMGLVLYNALLATGYEDLAGIHHEPLLQLPLLTLPSEPFTLSSSALSLLLGELASILSLVLSILTSRVF